MVQGCAALNCKNNTRNKQFKFYRFPKDKQRCAKWVANCGREDLLNRSEESLHTSYRLCSVHFEDTQQSFYKDRLVYGAVPTLFDLSNPCKRRRFKRVVQNWNAASTSPTTMKCMPFSQQERMRSILTDHDYFGKSPDEVAPRDGSVQDYEYREPEFNSVLTRVNSETSNTMGNSELQSKSGSILVETVYLTSKVTRGFGESGNQNSTQFDRKLTGEITNRLKQPTFKSNRQQKTSTFRVKMFRLRQKVKKLEAELSLAKCNECDGSVESIIKFAKNYIDGPALDFFTSQLKLSKKDNKGRRYTDKDMLLALDLVKLSPKAFKFLSKIFVLPTKPIIRRWLKKNGGAREGSESVQDPALGKPTNPDKEFSNGTSTSNFPAVVNPLVSEPELPVGEEVDHVGESCTWPLPQVSETTRNSNLPAIVDRLVGELGPLVVISLAESLVKSAAGIE